MNKRELRALKRLVERNFTFEFQEPGTAELVDENDPDGYVVIKDVKGAPRAFMPRYVYEELRQRK